MYSIVDIIVGIPLTEEIVEECTRIGSEPEDFGFEKRYSGGSEEPVGFLGIELGRFDECQEYLEVASLNISPAAAHLKAAQEKVDALPIELKKRALPVTVYFIFGSS